MIQVRYGRTGGGWGCLILGVLMLVAAWYILKWAFTLLWWAAPALFVLALIINWRAVADTGRDFLSMLERNPIGGLLFGALAVVGFPILALYLFLRALGYNRMGQFSRTMRGQREEQAPPEEEFVEFEELESRPKDVPPTPEEPLEPPPPPEKEPPAPGNPYDQLFK